MSAPRPARALFVVAAACLLAIGVYAVNGSFTRYFADDYCIAADARAADVVGQSLDWYATASGRLAQFVALLLSFGAAEASGGGAAWAVRIAPAALLIGWLAALTVCLREGLTIFERQPAAWGRAIALAAALLAASLAATPQFVQTFFWLTGIVTYPISVPLILLAGAIAARIWRGASGVGGALAAGALLLIAGLFSEPAATVIVALCGLALLAALLDDRRNGKRLIGLGICAAFAAASLAIIVLAPGNSVRQTTFTAAPSFVDALIETASYSAAYLVGGVVVFAPHGTFLALVAGALIGLTRPTAPAPARIAPVLAVLIALAALLAVIAAFMFPGVYATGDPPPARAFILIQSLIALLLGAAGWAVGGRLRARAPGGSRGLFAVACAVCAAVIVLNQIGWTGQYAAYASAWDALDRDLRAAEGAVRVAALPVDMATLGGLDALSSDPAFWVNLCAARYYGLESLAVD